LLRRLRDSPPHVSWIFETPTCFLKISLETWFFGFRDTFFQYPSHCRLILPTTRFYFNLQYAHTFSRLSRFQDTPSCSQDCPHALSTPTFFTNFNFPHPFPHALDNPTFLSKMPWDTLLRTPPTFSFNFARFYNDTHFLSNVIPHALKTQPHFCFFKFLDPSTRLWIPS